MPTWAKPYTIRRSTNILSFAVRQNWDALQIMGEACYLLKRKARANATFHFDDRQVSTITKVASAYDTDPDTGNWRYKIWGEYSDPVTEYPDIGVLTATVQGSGGVSSVWELAVDKYSFIPNRDEYAFDICRNELDSNGNKLENAVYMVFNTPPFYPTYITTLVYGIISPATNFDFMQPDVDNDPQYFGTLFSYEQWLSPTATIRSRTAPNKFLLAFPGALSDLTVQEGGFVKEEKATYWTTPESYSPAVKEWDVVVRVATGERFQVIDYTPIYIEDIFVSQHFDLVEVDPRSSIYNFTVQTT